MTVEQLLDDTTALIIEGKIDEALEKILADSANYPENAQVRFVIGALSAQTENYEQAIAEYQVAIGLKPDLQIARFQLGLLLVTLEQNAQGEQVLRSIENDENNYISCFAAGVIHLLYDDIESARSCILRGIELNNENASLNSDMTNLLQRMQDEQNAGAEVHEEISLNDSTSQQIAQVDDTAPAKPENSVANEKNGDEERSEEDTHEESADQESSAHLLDVYKRH